MPTRMLKRWMARAAARDRFSALDRQIEAALANRRRDRAQRQEAARQREADKRHRQFVADPLLNPGARP